MSDHYYIFAEDTKKIVGRIVYEPSTDMYEEDAEFSELEIIDEFFMEEFTIDEFKGNLGEAIVRRVTRDPSGTYKIVRTKDRKTRARQATQTTGLSKTKRKLVARKAARSRKRDKGGQRRALKKFRKTLKKRKALGVKAG